MSSRAGVPRRDSTPGLAARWRAGDPDGPAEGLRTRWPAIALTVAAAAWVGLLVWAPVSLARLPASPPSALARVTYLAGAVLCHQRPERSFTVVGHAMPVCARCFGLYVGGVGGLLAAAAWRARPVPSARRARILFAMASAPTVVTVLVEWLAILPVANHDRAMAAVPVAALAGWMLGAARWRARGGAETAGSVR